MLSNTNKEYKKRYNEYRKKRRSQDNQFAIIDRLRARLRKMVNSQNCIKYYKTQMFF